jgi:5-methyltetrahydropteroyltriglutamate--homocysteine methyltransferase
MADRHTGAGLEGGTILGYPRIGRRRQLKRALEGHWAGRIDADTLAQAAADIRASTWNRLHDLGLEAHDAAIPSDFSYYDQVLDAAVLVGAIPERFAQWRDDAGRLSLDGYFAMARGVDRVAPLEMTKWFDTNYHYLVPEIGPDTEFRLSGDQPALLFAEGLSHGFVTRPVIVGPVTLLALSKPAEGAPEGFEPLDRLDDLLPVYAEVLAGLAALDAPWVQLDESALVSELVPVDRARLLVAARHAYQVLGELAERPQILAQASYAALDDALPALAETPIEGVAIDLVRGDVPAADAPGVAGLRDKLVVAGVVDGHNIWRADLDAALERLEALRPLAGRVVPSSSTSLFHVPHTLDDETSLDPELRGWLAFADEKVAEIVALARAYDGDREGVIDAFEAARAAAASRRAHAGVHRPEVAKRLAGLTPADFARAPYAERAAVQADELHLPLLPTTTIGSFPQTPEIRRTRARHNRGEIDEATYREEIRGHIREVIELQERIGLDVLVHGEAERNDMVQYFAEHLEGFAVTENGWVQSYGSRCTRPSILWGDVVRPEPFTVEWIRYAQSLTEKPVKGMLTGPVTILAWSFVRDDQPRRDTADQVALALRDEISDLEAAGIDIVQVDEPAIRELLPLKRRDHADYLDWSVSAFRLATSGARTRTQIHTHLCYSEFGQIIDAVDGLDADVTSVEAERSRMDIVRDIRAAGFARGIGPGVYDIHSPRVPAEDDVEQLLDIALDSIPASQLWVNPDCGLKTRRYEEVVPALTHMVEAARGERARLDA